MPIRIAADKDQPSVAIEIPIEKPLPDYDLEQIEQPTPRDIDALLVSQGFRDLVDDARGVLTELMCNPPPLPNTTHLVDLGLSHVPDFEITQLTGAICPSDDEVYRPGLWIVLKDRKSPAKQTLGEVAMEHARIVAHELVKRLGINRSASLIFRIELLFVHSSGSNLTFVAQLRRLELSTRNDTPDEEAELCRKEKDC